MVRLDGRAERGDANVVERDINPEEAFRAMLLEVGSLVVVAASWPMLSQHMCHRVMREYVATALCLRGKREVATDGAGQPVAIVVGGNLGGLHHTQIDNIAIACDCKVVMNGSATVCVTLQSHHSGDIKIDPVMVNEPCITVARTAAAPASPCALLLPPAMPPLMLTDDDTISAAQPATEITLKPNTPLYNDFLDAMQGDATGTGKEILDFLANTCFFGNVCYFDEQGNKLHRRRTVAFKMEVMLEKVLEQKALAHRNARERQISAGVVFYQCCSACFDVVKIYGERHEAFDE